MNTMPTWKIITFALLGFFGLVLTIVAIFWVGHFASFLLPPNMTK